MKLPWAAMLILGASACQLQRPTTRETQRPNLSSNQITSDLALVREHRILFFHHSVGSNLLSGLQRLSTAAGAPLRMISFERAKTDRGPGVVEISGGQNHHPRSKVDYFADAIRSYDLAPELAFMKLCYVDFEPNTDVDAIFDHYQHTIAALEQRYPEIVFAHVTVPLVTQPVAIKQRINRLLGRPVWEDVANTKRHAFNQRLLATYANAPVFDLARAECTRPDGSVETFKYKGRTYYDLVPAYTDDDGHLNRMGQDAISPKMLHFMATALQTVPQPANQVTKPCAE